MRMLLSNPFSLGSVFVGVTVGLLGGLLALACNRVGEALSDVRDRKTRCEQRC